MPTPNIGLDKTLAALGVTRPEQVSERFATIRAHFDGQFQTVQSESEWKLFRDAWLARKSGVITQITDNWLKPATPELKRAVGASLNDLRPYVDTQIETRHAAIERAADSATSAKDRIDLSLPGVIRPIASQHLVSSATPGTHDNFCSIR